MPPKSCLYRDGLFTEVSINMYHALLKHDIWSELSLVSLKVGPRNNFLMSFKGTTCTHMLGHVNVIHNYKIKIGSFFSLAWHPDTPLLIP